MQARLKNLPLRTSLVFLVILITLNAVYYFNTKAILLDNQKSEMRQLYNSVQVAIEKSAEGEKIVEDLIGVNLRTASVAAQYKLDPDIEKVTNEQLKELSKSLGIDDITLFAKTADDIVGTKSSDPKEINVSSKGWSGYYAAFQQLFAMQDPTVGIGQTLPHFWTGPMDTSTTNQGSVDKWGYYYDGTTNYIIDPFVHDTHFREYQKKTGVDNEIAKLVSVNQDISLEISVLNTEKLLGIKRPDAPADNWHSVRLVLFGSYNGRDPDEVRYATQAIETKQPVYYTATSNGKMILKSFTPLDTEYLKFDKDRAPLLIAMSTDYTKLQSILNSQLKQTIIFILLSTAGAVLIIVLYGALMRNNQERVAKSVQEAYVGNIESLFHKVREQRHDYNNHIATIQALATMGKLPELRAYTNSLVGENKIINDAINIGIPAVVGLIQAKLAKADSENIQFEQDFSNMDYLELQAIKVTDLVKILSNLIDNALHATKALSDPAERKVQVSGKVLSNQIQFKVMNTGLQIPPEKHKALFEKGYSTKDTKKHSGLGLHIVKNLIAGYKGSIHVENMANGVQFTVMIPINK